MTNLNKTTLALLALVSQPLMAVDKNYYYENVSRTTIDNVVVGNSIANGYSAYCTATILGGNIVLTAAHCGTGSSVDTSYQGNVSVKKTTRPSHYLSEVVSNPYTGDMDVAVWTLNTDVKHKVFSPLTTNQLADNTLLTMYGYGGTKPTLNAIYQRSLQNWHWGGSTSCSWDGATPSSDGDGYCETIPEYEMVAYEIGKGRQSSGDSGMAFFTPTGYVVAVNHSNSVRMIMEAAYEYHAEMPSISDMSTVVSSDADMSSTNGSWGLPLSYADAQTFILSSVNAWNYASWLPNVTTSPKTVKFQSLKSSAVNLLNTISTTGDVNIDFDSLVCFEPEQDSNTGAHHSASSVQPFEVCMMDVTSNGGAGQITLDTNQVIHVNAWDVSSDTGSGGGSTSTGGSSGGDSGGDSGGGSMGAISLLASLALVWSRRKERKTI